MKLIYYKDTDSLYIDLSDKSGVDTIVLSDDVVADIDEHGKLVGIDIQYASKKLNLTELVSDIPLTHAGVAAG